MIEVLVSAVVLCNNFNLHELPCSAPVDSFVVDENGEASGELLSGIPFTQTNVANDFTRLQKFQLQNAYWYISDKGTFDAENDLQALSIYLAL